MKLQTKDLKRFKSATSNIRQNGALPILSYLKFNDGTITENNLQSFVSMDADFEGSVLIDKKLLMSFVDATGANEIDVTVKGKMITLTDGKIKKQMPTDDIVNFPSNDIAEGDPILLDKNVLSAIGIALQFTSADMIMNFKECVFIGNGFVCASDGFSAYMYPVSKDLPEIILTPDAAKSISKMESVLYSNNASYTFFDSGDIKMGFSKNEVKFVNMVPFSVYEGPGIKINKTEIIKFCEMCISDCAGRLPVTYFSSGIMTMADQAFGITNETPLSVPLPDFIFNPSVMAKALKSLPDQEIEFIKSDNKFHLIGNSGFTSLIMEIKL